MKYLLILALLLSPWGYAKDSDPYVVVERVASAMFDRIDNELGQIRQNPEHLRTIVNQELIPSIDYRYSGYKVIGRHLRSTNKAQRDAFVTQFRDYLSTTFAQLFTRYEKGRFTYQFLPRKKVRDEKFVTVRVMLKEAGKPDIPVDFKMRRNKQGSWRAFDVVTEGVSMLDSKGAELTDQIRKQGIDSVTTLLVEKNQQKITLEARS